MYLMMIKHHCCWCGMWMFLKQSHSGMADMGSMKLDTNETPLVPRVWRVLNIYFGCIV